MAVVLAEHNFWLPPPIKPNKPHFADPTRGVPPLNRLLVPRSPITRFWTNVEWLDNES